MDNRWLYEEYDILSKRNKIDRDIPLYIKDNLKPQFKLRPYQVEALARFMEHYGSSPSSQIQLLFNMATGSGKTLIMAGLIVYLYAKGYRNFLFFVNSTNVIEKTKYNFLNERSGKYLFNSKLFINSKTVYIRQVDNFEGVSGDDINIVFTTIQGLHADLHAEKENSLTFEDFKDKKIVLLSDEAHHTNVQTKKKKNQDEKLFEDPNWENTVEKILQSNRDNILLEFTATMDFLNKGIEEKYKNRTIYQYDLRQFREDGYSKEVNLLQADLDEQKRILLAIILNQYRQEVAAKYRINLKPVILFKAQKTILESKENMKKFHALIESLSEEQIGEIEKVRDVPVIRKAFRFFKEHGITREILIKKLRVNFAPTKCIGMNEEEEKEKQQILINSLEDKDNQIRVIFTVDKLNEGWDVLNLFDIVRLYATRQSGWGKVAPTTIKEAQLIGRGARYFPFTTKPGEVRDMRKYDEDIENELRILEDLHYHSVYDTSYIAELKQALKKEGLIDDDIVDKQLTLKDAFTKTSFYKHGHIYLNKQIDNTFEMIQSFEDIGVKRRNYRHNLFTSRGKDITIFEENGNGKEERQMKQIDMPVGDISVAIIRKALATNPFFTFSSIKHYFPHVKSAGEFIIGKQYLSGLSITFEGTSDMVADILPIDMFEAMKGLLTEIEIDLKSNTKQRKGSYEFAPDAIGKIFYNKILRINKKNERADGQESFVDDLDWYVFNANYGTSEEKAFVLMFARQIEKLEENYKDIYLIRNEQHFKIYNFADGQPFQPDFVLFMKERKTGKALTYQIFIEPKGRYLQKEDQWKADFMNEIKERFKDKVLKFSESRQYRIVGVPFYDNEDENIFKAELLETVGIS